MPKLNITKPELVWPGKYDDDGNLVENRGAALPFQVIESIKEGRATRKSGQLADLFTYAASQNDTENWHNKLIWGDNLLVMASLLKDFAGKIDLIYIDPPFGTGSDFSYKVLVGDEDSPVPGKEPSIIEEKAYRDTWAQGWPTYLSMLYHRLVQLHALLADTGSVFVHVDVHAGPYVKALMDEVFGRDNFQNEIAWYYYNKMHDSRKRLLPKAFDQILYYVKNKSSNYTYSRLEEERDKPVRQLKRAKVDGKMVNARDEDGNIIYQERTTRTVDSVWRIRCLQPANKTEWVHYGTQKPVDLIERVIQLASKPGDIVLDAFVGSGSSAVAAERQGRRWIACDLGRYAIHTTRKRLLEIPDCKPFQLLNLGRYERQHWQGTEFGQSGDDQTKAAYAAYIRFILELYQAQPIEGEYIHGKKGGTLVMVGAVDAPVTISQINDGLAECAEMEREELHVLAWEWEMGMNDPIIKQARTDGVRLRLLNIPREVMERQAVDCKDIRFFDLAYLEAEIKTIAKKKDGICIELTNFVIPDTDLIPADVRDKISKWSDYIDYWAVDWDFQHDTFTNQWQTYRTRKNRKLELTSEAHTYDEPGTYKILIKVVDIFGNDTSRMLEWKAEQ
ncbi:MAG: site-specific DNA-methyltransferase [Lentisphaeria bacterium]|nr:site-specific DNA-methyltransferase [Lentisphaeria bacterium]